MLSVLLGYLNSAAAIVFVLGLCLMFHEAGHFLVAKACGMKVEEFAFGFGPSLLRFRKGETLYRFNIFFFIGAYVRIAGMEPGAEYIERGFHAKPRWQGALVILAGSAANIVLAMLIFAIVTLWTGLPDPKDPGVYVAKVAADGPAEHAGVLPGDKLLAIDGQRFSLDVAAVAAGSPAAKVGLRKGNMIYKVGDTEVYTPGELMAALRQHKAPTQVEVVDYEAKDLKSQFRQVQLPALPAATGTPAAVEMLLLNKLGLRFEPLQQTALVGYINLRPEQRVTLTVERQGRSVELPMMTMATQGRKEGRDEKGMLYSHIKRIGRIGIVMRGATRPAGVAESLQLGVIRTYGMAATAVFFVRAMLQRQVEAELVSPVGIMAISAERARIGWDAVLNWCGMISAMLALTNLFPFPPFDGFKAVLIGVEGLMRRRVPARLETAISLAGFIMVLSLGVVLIFKDSANLILHGTP